MKARRFNSKEVIYFLPNLFTTGNLFCGFFSIISSLQDLYIQAAIAIFVAGIFDILDGRIARLTKSHSPFGVEYDSLSDLVSFGIAPAMLMYLWSLESLGRIGWLICFIFLGCGALRLARFNSKHSATEKSFFQGLPIPMAAYVMAATPLLFYEFMLDEYKNYFNLSLTAILGFLMVSQFKYRSFKDLDLKNRGSFGFLVFVVFLLIIVAYNPGVMMFVVFIGYMLSGPLFYLFTPSKKKIQKCHPREGGDLSIRLIERKEISHDL